MWLWGQGGESEGRCHGLLAKAVSEKKKQYNECTWNYLLMHTSHQLIVCTDNCVFKWQKEKTIYSCDLHVTCISVLLWTLLRERIIIAVYPFSVSFWNHTCRNETVHWTVVVEWMLQWTVSFQPCTMQMRLLVNCWIGLHEAHQEQEQECIMRSNRPVRYTRLISTHQQTCVRAL